MIPWAQGVVSSNLTAPTKVFQLLTDISRGGFSVPLGAISGLGTPPGPTSPKWSYPPSCVPLVGRLTTDNDGAAPPHRAACVARSTATAVAGALERNDRLR